MRGDNYKDLTEIGVLAQAVLCTRFGEKVDAKKKGRAIVALNRQLITRRCRQEKEARLRASGRYCLLQGKALHYLTPKQATCVACFLEGMSYKQIAREVDLSHRTLERQFSRIKAMCGVESLGELKHALKDGQFVETVGYI